VVPLTFALGAVLVYGFLILTYSQFYAELGVRSSEVGVQYGPGVGGIAGVALVLIVFAGLPAAIYALAARRYPKLATHRAIALAAAVILVGVCALTVAFFVKEADDRADRVKKGAPLEPVRFIGLEILSMGADLASLRPVGRRSAFDDIPAELRGRSDLLY
jgi:hypothetical protein